MRRVKEGRRVLVIDDDPDFSDFVEIVLTAHGYRVGKVSTALDALDTLEASTPDLVIADVMLSYTLGGWSVLREMRASIRLQQVPVLLVSAVVRDGEEQLFPDDSCLWDRFLHKPIAPDELVAALDELMSGKEVA